MNLKDELSREQVSHLDLSGFCEVAADSSLRHALAELRSSGHNVCLVTENGRLVGIFTDRDVTTKVASGNLALDTAITEIMTPNPVTIPPSISAAEALSLMDRKNVRNLPVVNDRGEIAGTMTHRTIVRFLANRYPTVVLNLPPRPGQYADRVDGGD